MLYKCKVSILTYVVCFLFNITKYLAAFLSLTVSIAGGSVSAVPSSNKFRVLQWHMLSMFLSFVTQAVPLSSALQSYGWKSAKNLPFCKT